MRIMPRLSPVVMAMLLVACSERDTAANAIDVEAAAAKAQSDIANYAAADASRAAAVGRSPVPAASTVDPVVRREPAPAEVERPDEVVRRYVAAIADKRYADAWRLWEDNGAASGMTEAAFAASFARYARFVASVGTPTDEDAGAGQRYVTVPVTVTGTLRSGAPFRLEGPVILHRVADGLDIDDPAAHAWRIRSSEMKSQPARAPDLHQ
jgi:hypothetical protein